MSPFLSDGWLSRLADSGGDHVLISRTDSLDRISEDTFARIQATNTQVYVMQEGIEYPGDLVGEPLEPITSFPADDCSGLHAKLYIAEEGWDARLITGSANATNSAFDGHNVEFMVELKGKRSKVGIDRLLGDTKDRDSFFGMLQRYERPSTPVPSDAVQRELERLLNDARCRLADCNLSLAATADSQTRSLYA